MAHDINQDFRPPFLRRLFFKLNGPEHLKKWRASKRAKMGISEEVNQVEFDGSFDASSNFGFDWQEASGHYQEHGWFFCDPFLAPDFHSKVSADWPEKVFLNPPKRSTKWYNNGFFWAKNRDLPLRYLDHHQGLAELMQALGSAHFLEQISKLADCEMEFSEFHVTDSGEGAEVPMHLDGLLKTENGDKALGIAIFMDGTGGERSGGLCVSGSSSWADLIFEPPMLKNTALIYSKKLHHGFLPIVKGKFRHSINTQFWPQGTTPE